MKVAFSFNPPVTTATYKPVVHRTQRKDSASRKAIHFNILFAIAATGPFSSQLNPVYTLKPYFGTGHFNNILLIYI
jgi:hypothetical protein